MMIGCRDSAARSFRSEASVHHPEAEAKSPHQTGTRFRLTSAKKALSAGRQASYSARMRTILLIILVLLLIGALPTWPYSSGWGYYPSGGLIILIILVLFLVKV